ncbi:hypothetical protein CAEBREN_01283 [Caenorhabditis brenneri]|uniref:Homeobox domain-containing protein n=1 Tax=Caenorhabditis brenneri TaxID=135651 RepID=G0PI77_CAEBE|nr:hypothetical protein CAEBREN_01283 [Caenorhabditis brenneri]
MEVSKSKVDINATVEGNPIPTEIADLLRVEFEFVHFLSCDKKANLAKKYGLHKSQVAQFFEVDMKEQREQEKRTFMSGPKTPATTGTSNSSEPTTSASRKKKMTKAEAKQQLRVEYQQNSKLPASRKNKLAETLGLKPEEVREFFLKQRNKKGWFPKSINPRQMWF